MLIIGERSDRRCPGNLCAAVRVEFHLLHGVSIFVAFRHSGIVVYSASVVLVLKRMGIAPLVYRLGGRIPDEIPRSAQVV